MIQLYRNYYAYRFGFNGKENIDEVTGSTGTHLDFGARVYDSRIGRWTACDPLAAKYPSLSSYCFVGNMPIIAIDPDGNQIQVISNDPEYRNYILTEIQKLTSDELIMDENGIISISTKSIDPSKEFGTCLVGELIESTNTHSIFEGNTSYVKPIIGGEEEAENGKGTGTIIMIEQNPSENPNANVMMENGEFESSPNEIVLGHELIHTYNHDQGIVDKTREIDGDNYPPENPGNFEPLRNEEINTRNKENILRQEQGYGNRRRVSVPFSPAEMPEIEIRMQRN